jgi:hypothetical protein
MLCSCCVGVQGSDYLGAQPKRERPKGHYIECNDVRYDASVDPVSEMSSPMAVCLHTFSLKDVASPKDQAMTG